MQFRSIHSDQTLNAREMRETTSYARDNWQCGGEWEVKAKFASLPQNAGDLAIWQHLKESRAINPE
jgi:hypothetical protein